MSLLSSFVGRHLIPTLEESLIAHEPAMKVELLNEIKALTAQINAWVDSKLQEKVK